jgi:hypothetical protein
VLSELTGWERTAWEATALLALTLVVALAFWLGRRSVGNVARTTIAWGEVGRTPGAEVNTLNRIVALQSTQPRVVVGYPLSGHFRCCQKRLESDSFSAILLRA